MQTITMFPGTALILRAIGEEYILPDKLSLIVIPFDSNIVFFGHTPQEWLKRDKLKCISIVGAVKNSFTKKWLWLW